MILLKRIQEIETGNRFILGVDGLSRSGKTILGNKLSAHLKEMNIPFHIFHIDDHIVERKKRYDTGFEQWYEYYNLQWDIDWLSQNFFDKIKKSSPIRIPFYDKESDTQSIRNIQLPNACVIIIEGVFLQRKEWRNFFDYIVFLDCPRDDRFLRESKEAQRGMEKLNQRYWKAEEYYLETEIPIQKANLVLNG
ncbi:kinase [Psychrobacillus sp. FSL H8-0484]|uniref:kinase n=1 Tax=Psychrobacillus sp. FSL H8-0484 TaxID=2921390 RepID=UPI0030F74CE1